jgi:drug/metabolite transporter (DMT)-like permease
VRRVGQLLAAVFVLLGVFWVGRESEHGLAAFWEHWWCPIPLVAIVLGIASVITMQRLRPAS